jgi:chromate reductase, NAD(P)H dehydrogenase (quinone)
MNVTIISASSRAKSNSTRFANYLSHLLKENGVSEVNILDFVDCDIPNVGRGSVNPEQLTAFQKDLISKWEKAHIVIFAVPEYNWSTNGEFINALHQLGTKNFAHLFDNKTFAIAGVSAGRGGKSPALEIMQITNKIISFSNKYAVISPRLYESHETGANINEDLVSSNNEMYTKTVNDFVIYTLEIANRWFKS